MSADLIELVQNLGQPRVLVVGDLMLDRYVWGDAERISQEAPVILLRADRREERLGGASSVATLLRALGAKPALAGVVGADADGARIRQMLLDQGIGDEAVLNDSGRPSTVKERYIGRAQHRHPQQMIRVDYEERKSLAPALEREMLQVIGRQMRQTDVVLISDYDKGVCTPTLLAAVIAAARACGVKTLADPVRGGDYRKYHGCSAITPNRLEAGLATGRVLNDSTAALEGAAELRERLDLDAAVVTLDKEGMALAHADGRRRGLPDAAAAGLRHHRRRRHGDGGAWAWPWPPAPTTTRPSAWPTSPAVWRSKKSASPSSRATRSFRTCCGPAIAVKPDGTRCGCANRWSARSRRVGRWASVSPSPTAASTCCTPATCSICRRLGRRRIASWSG